MDFYDNKSDEMESIDCETKARPRIISVRRTKVTRIND